MDIKQLRTSTSYLQIDNLVEILNPAPVLYLTYIDPWVKNIQLMRSKETNLIAKQALKSQNHTPLAVSLTSSQITQQSVPSNNKGQKYGVTLSSATLYFCSPAGFLSRAVFDMEGWLGRRILKLLHSTLAARCSYSLACASGTLHLEV